jgi:hypothetical protein
MSNPVKRFRKKIQIALLLLTTCVGQFQPAQANFQQYEQYGSEQCEVNVYTSKVIRIINCQTGAFIRYELLEYSETKRYYDRYYCDGGVGACETSDPLCTTEEEITQVINTSCEL